VAQPQLDASVIVASYYQLESTTLALRALFAQQTQYRYEVIVCDDGSDAATVGALRDVLESAPVPAYLAWQQDRGFRAAASRNNGIRMARGRIIIMLDGDMVPEENFVENHTRAHEREGIVAIGHRRWRNPQDATLAQQDVYGLWTVLRDVDAVERLTGATEVFEMLYRHVLWKAVPWMACFTCNISVPKSPVVEFDESFVGWGYEDYDLAYALNAIHGYEVVPIDADAYEVRGRIDMGKTWSQGNFIAHLVNGFRMQEKWASTGLRPEQSIPRYDLDPATGLWSFSGLPIVGGRNNDFPEYVERTRAWLIQEGLYPKLEPVLGAEGEGAFSPTQALAPD